MQDQNQIAPLQEQNQAGNQLPDYRHNWMANKALASVVERQAVPHDQQPGSLEFMDASSTSASTATPGATFYASSASPEAAIPSEPVITSPSSNGLPPLNIPHKSGLFHSLVARPFRLSAIFLSSLVLIGGGVFLVS